MPAQSFTDDPVGFGNALGTLNLRRGQILRRLALGVGFLNDDLPGAFRFAQ